MAPTQQPPPPPFTTALIAGGMAGTTVDMSLFPLDTLKTRLQSAEGFFTSGGFRGIYRGVGSALVGSAPGAAFFFCTYESTKSRLTTLREIERESQSTPFPSIAGKGELLKPIDLMIAASLGEVAACAVRVPTEVVKQRAQAGLHGGSSMAAFMAILGQQKTMGIRGVWNELYRGWGITLLREVPFTMLQFPIWEALKNYRRVKKNGAEVTAFESGMYGSVAGAVAAGLTTPLDVLKTRVMLSKEKKRIAPMIHDIIKTHGLSPFFSGIGPRVAWISAGGAIFLGSYQFALNLLQGNVASRRQSSLPFTPNTG